MNNRYKGIISKNSIKHKTCCKLKQDIHKLVIFRPALQIVGLGIFLHISE